MERQHSDQIVPYFGYVNKYFKENYGKLEKSFSDSSEEDFPGKSRESFIIKSTTKLINLQECEQINFKRINYSNKIFTTVCFESKNQNLEFIFRKVNNKSFIYRTIVCFF